MNEREVTGMFTRVLTENGMGAGVHEPLRTKIVSEWVRVLTEATVEHFAKSCDRTKAPTTQGDA